MERELDRINSILHNEFYIKCIRKIQNYEVNRVYCGHNIEHFLDVARIAYIINLEKKLNIKKDIIYAAALLHDIGRWKQYQDGTPHHIASVELSIEILKSACYKSNEIDDITRAIGGHRSINSSENTLESIIYFSDKKSRNCFKCAARESCNWMEENKNYNIVY
jgi:HD superfamily phosphodiesterase